MAEHAFPSAAEVRSGMRRIKVAVGEVETLQKAQIAQSIFGARIDSRVKVAQALVVALASLNEATVMYLALLGLQEGEEYPSVAEEAV